MIKISDPITTLSLFKYSSIRNKFWAFGMMRKAQEHLQNIEGMVFYKLMGSGKVLGAPLPDWSVYALLQVWENEKAAIQFVKKSELMITYRRYGKCCTFFLSCLASHGKWSKHEPFQVNKRISNNTLPVAVITRATISTKYLLKFWRQAKKAQEPFLQAPGLLYTKGIGEVPIRQMATFSIWNNLESMRQVAYKNVDHQNAIRMTRQFDWYHEELFARFSLYRVNGDWEGLSHQLEDLGVATTNITP